MRKGIHPDYTETTITCACGNVIETRATQEGLHIEICSACHPFYTGKQKFVDTAGRVEKFQTRYGDAWKEKHKKPPSKQVVTEQPTTEATTEG